MATAVQQARTIAQSDIPESMGHRLGSTLGKRALAVAAVLCPPDGWIAASLLALNMVIVVWSVEVADWAPTPSLALVMLLAIFTALALARIRLWAAILLPAGFAIGAGVIIWQFTTVPPHELRIASDGEFFSRLWAWALAAKNEGISVDPLPFSVGLMIASWASGFLGGWFFFRYRNFWGVFALGTVGLLSNLTFLPDNASVYLGVYLFTGLLLVGWVQSVRSRQRWDEQGRVYDGHLGILTASDTTAVALVALFIAFLIPAGGQWGPAHSFYNLTRTPLVQWEEDFNRLFAGLPARRPLPYRIWGDTMAFQGTINPTDTPVLQVNANVPMYWKARSYATYTHEGWISDGTVLKEPGWTPDYSEPSPQRERFNTTFEVIPRYESRSMFAGGQAIGASRDVRIETFDSPRYVIDPHSGVATDDLPAALRQAVEGVRTAVSTDAFASDETVVADIPAVFVPETVERDDDGRVQKVVLGEIVPADPDVLAVKASGGAAGPGDPYQLTASVSSAGPDDLRTAGAEYAPWVWARYTQLPPDIPERVEELTRSITADAETPYDKAVAVETWLKENITYNLSIEPPPFGSDGVDYFLFESREGYSEYFGSAMTVMMRSIGIPARMTTGYTTGKLITGDNLYLVSDHHSHGWTEVYFPDFGWIPFEPTPGREIPLVIPPEEQAKLQLLTPSTDGSGDLPCEIEEDCEELDALFETNAPEESVDVVAAWLQLARQYLPWIIGVSSGIFVAALIAVGVWRWLLATPGDAISAYRRLQRLGRVASLGAARHHTPHQWAAMVADAVPQHRRAVLQIANAYAFRTYSGRDNAEDGPQVDVAEAWREVRLPLALHALRRREA